jgi:hypothetical protein
MFLIGNIATLMPLLMAIATFGSMAFGWFMGSSADDASLPQAKVIVVDGTPKDNIQIKEISSNTADYLDFISISTSDNIACETKNFFPVSRNCQYGEKPLTKKSTPNGLRYMGLSPPVACI